MAIVVVCSRSDGSWTLTQGKGLSQHLAAWESVKNRAGFRYNAPASRKSPVGDIRKKRYECYPHGCNETSEIVRAVGDEKGSSQRYSGQA
jgi:hypothetical protein